MTTRIKRRKPPTDRFKYNGMVEVARVMIYILNNSKLVWVSK